MSFQDYNGIFLWRLTDLAEYYSDKATLYNLTGYEVMLHESVCRYLETHFNKLRIELEKTIDEQDEER